MDQTDEQVRLLGEVPPTERTTEANNSGGMLSHSRKSAPASTASDASAIAATMVDESMPPLRNAPTGRSLTSRRRTDCTTSRRTWRPPASRCAWRPSPDAMAGAGDEKS